MSEYLKKIIIPNFSGEENEITILSPDEVYTKDQVYPRDQVYTKDQIDGFDLVAVVKISQADYNKLDDYSPRTLYVIPDKRIYLGNSLVWKKPVYKDNDLAGSWDEDSSSSQWGFYSNNTFISLKDVTDTETKEFIKDLSDYSGTTNKLGTSGVRRLYHVPKNGGIDLGGSPGSSTIFNTSLISADFSGVKFGANANELFDYCKSLKSLNLSDVNTSGVTSMLGMFSGCKSLKSLDLSSFNTSSVTNTFNMFGDCSSLESLDLSSFNTSEVTDMEQMFYGCKSLKSLDLSSFDTSKVTSMRYMFLGCASLESLDLSSFDTSSVTNMWSTFAACSSLKSLDLSSFNTSKVTNMYNMFDTCDSLKSLDLSSFDTSSVTSMGGMFGRCYSLQSLNLSSFDTSSVTSMGGMFTACSSLESLDLSSFNTSEVTDMGYMFQNCYSLQSLNLSSFDTSKVTYMSGMFSNCTSLVDVVGPIRGIKLDLNLSFCSKLSQESAMVFIEGLETVTSTKTITFSQNTFDSLTPEQISIATSKGWTVVRN